jgi:hypothetical protein
MSKDVVALQQRVEDGCELIRNMPGIFECLQQSRMCCVEAEGRQFEHFFVICYKIIICDVGIGDL